MLEKDSTVIVQEEMSAVSISSVGVDFCDYCMGY